MPCNDSYTCFRKVSHYGSNKLSNELEINLKSWLDWSFLKIGAWSNVYTGTDAPWGNNFYSLKSIHIDGITDGRVWIGPRKDWAYETGVNYTTPVLTISSVASTGGGSATVQTTVNNYFQAGDTVTISNTDISAYNNEFTITSVNSLASFDISTTGTGTTTIGSLVGQTNPLPVTVSVDGQAVTTGTSGNEHYIHYPYGLVIFDSAKPTGSTTVHAQYSYRDVQTYLSDDAPWIIETQFDSLRPDSNNWDNIDFLNRGDWGAGPQNRIQLPAIIIETVDYRGGKAYELGNLSLIEKPQIIFNVLSQTKKERNNIVNILTNQKHHVIRLFDSDLVAKSGDWALDYRSTIVNQPNMYPDLVEDYFWKKCWWEDVSVSEVKTGHPNLFIARVRASFQVIIA